MNQNLLPQIDMEHLGAFLHPALSLSNRSAQRSTILVIFDSDTLHQYLCERLNTSYKIIVATNSQDGMEMAISRSPDLIISGLMTVDVDGDSLCFRLKQNEKTSHIPVLILSGRPELCNRVKSFSFGADDYLTWPFLQVELQIRIHNLIQSRKLLQQKYSAQWNSKSSSSTVESADQLYLQRALAVVERHLKNSQFGSELFAKEMGVSQRHLSRKLILLSGIPASQFIRKIRLLRAGELLATNAGKVSEVAYRVGFNNLSYFTKCFKALHKSLPHDYAKRSGV